MKVHGRGIRNDICMVVQQQELDWTTEVVLTRSESIVYSEEVAKEEEDVLDSSESSESATVNDSEEEDSEQDDELEPPAKRAKVDVEDPYDVDKDYTERDTLFTVYTLDDEVVFQDEEDEA